MIFFSEAEKKLKMSYLQMDGSACTLPMFLRKKSVVFKENTQKNVDTQKRARKTIYNRSTV